MKKSVYSLVLMDNIVGEVDRLAHSLNTSRSNLINQILAEYVSYTTPQKQMKNMLLYMEKCMEGLDFQIKSQPSESMIYIHSALRFKYNPSIRYSVELLRNTEPAVGVLKVYFRTRNKQLLYVLESFFNLWYELEKKYSIQRLALGQINRESDGFKYIREFVHPGNVKHQSGSGLASAISEYIRMFDSALKLYFERLGSPSAAVLEIESLYREAITRGISIDS